MEFRCSVTSRPTVFSRIFVNSFWRKKEFHAVVSLFPQIESTINLNMMENSSLLSLMTSIQMSLLEQVDVDTLERMLSVSGVGRFKQLRFKYKKSKYSAKTALKKNAGTGNQNK